MQLLLEMPDNEKKYDGSRFGAASRAGLSENHTRQSEIRPPRTAQEQWQRERAKAIEKARERQRERQELEGGWRPPEIDSRRVHEKNAYKSPRVSVPPKSRVVSEYL